MQPLKRESYASQNLRAINRISTIEIFDMEAKLFTETAAIAFIYIRIAATHAPSMPKGRQYKVQSLP
jgi:hypothetical protein